MGIEKRKKQELPGLVAVWMAYIELYKPQERGGKVSCPQCLSIREGKGYHRTHITGRWV